MEKLGVVKIEPILLENSGELSSYRIGQWTLEKIVGYFQTPLYKENFEETKVEKIMAKICYARILTKKYFLLNLNATKKFALEHIF